MNAETSLSVPARSDQPLILKQAVISKDSLSDVSRSGTLFCTCAFGLVLSGAPALLFFSFWTALDGAALLNVSASYMSVFRLFYVVSLASIIPLIIMVVGFRLLSSNLDRLAAVFEIS